MRGGGYEGCPIRGVGGVVAKCDRVRGASLERVGRDVVGLVGVDSRHVVEEQADHLR